MRAAVYHGAGDVSIEEVAIPTPAAGEVLLKVSTVGICGTDAGEWHHGPAMYSVHTRHPVTGHSGPLIPGHEFGGTVVDVGPGVTRAAIGTLMASGGVIVCGQCRPCQTGRGPCANYSCVGLHRHGALAEYATLPLASCAPADAAGLTPDETALCQPMAIAEHACRRADVTTGEMALVQGVGGIGAFLVHALARRGIGVDAFDPQPDRRAIAADLGANRVFDAAGDDSDPGPADYDVVFEVSGSPTGLRASIAQLRPGTRLVLVGIQKQPTSLNLGRFTAKENDILTTNGLSPAIDLPAAVAAIASRHGRWQDVAPKVVPLEAFVADALQPLSAGKPGPIKRLVSPTASATRPLDTTGF